MSPFQVQQLSPESVHKLGHAFRAELQRGRWRKQQRRRASSVKLRDLQPPPNPSTLMRRSSHSETLIFRLSDYSHCSQQQVDGAQDTPRYAEEKTTLRAELQRGRWRKQQRRRASSVKLRDGKPPPNPSTLMRRSSHSETLIFRLSDYSHCSQQQAYDGQATPRYDEEKTTLKNGYAAEETGVVVAGSNELGSGAGLVTLDLLVCVG